MEASKYDSDRVTEGTPQLWGIDDNKEAQRIRKETVSRFSLRQRLGTQLAVGVVVIVVTIIWAEFFNFPTGWPRVALIFMAMALASIWQDRRLTARLPETLRSEGRCTKCGYDLKGTGDDPCPECGRKQSENTCA